MQAHMSGSGWYCMRSPRCGLAVDFGGLATGFWGSGCCLRCVGWLLGFPLARRGRGKARSVVAPVRSVGSQVASGVVGCSGGVWGLPCLFGRPFAPCLRVSGSGLFVAAVICLSLSVVVLLPVALPPSLSVAAMRTVRMSGCPWLCRCRVALRLSALLASRPPCNSCRCCLPPGFPTVGAPCAVPGRAQPSPATHPASASAHSLALRVPGSNRHSQLNNSS